MPNVLLNLTYVYAGRVQSTAPAGSPCRTARRHSPAFAVGCCEAVGRERLVGRADFVGVGDEPAFHMARWNRRERDHVCADAVGRSR